MKQRRKYMLRASAMTELCRCGHAGSEHDRELPSPCGHGKRPAVEEFAGADLMSPEFAARLEAWFKTGCQCCGFRPAETAPALGDA